MNTPITMKIIERFYEALYTIIEKHLIRGVATYCRLYDIDRRNLYKQKKDLNRGWFQVSWLYPLVKNYGVNAEWLLTGKGKMFIQ